VKARLADLGGTALPGSPADFEKLVVDDKEKWAKVIRAANIKSESCALAGSKALPYGAR
jgi:hypothetical protein